MNATTTEIKVRDFGSIIIIEFEGTPLVSMRRDGRGWSATDGQTTARGSKVEVLIWAKVRAVEIKARCGGCVY